MSETADELLRLKGELQRIRQIAKDELEDEEDVANRIEEGIDHYDGFHMLESAFYSMLSALEKIANEQGPFDQ